MSPSQHGQTPRVTGLLVQQHWRPDRFPIPDLSGSISFRFAPCITLSMEIFIGDFAWSIWSWRVPFAIYYLQMYRWKVGMYAGRTSSKAASPSKSNSRSLQICFLPAKCKKQNTNPPPYLLFLWWGFIQNIMDSSGHPISKVACRKGQSKGSRSWRTFYMMKGWRIWDPPPIYFRKRKVN